MNKTTTITIKTDPEVKESAKKLSSLMGLSLSDTINVLLRNYIKDRRLVSAPFEFPLDNEGEYKEEFVGEMLERKNNQDKTKFSTVDDFIAHLEN